ncbi:hypothetical protein Hanom_Chr09g00769871 [Helianthus anomalus]
MALGAGSEIEICYIDQGVKCPFLKVWGKSVKTTKPQGAKQKFTLKCILVILCEKIFIYLYNRYSLSLSLSLSSLSLLPL